MATPKNKALKKKTMGRSKLLGFALGQSEKEMHQNGIMKDGKVRKNINR